ncbi:MAG: hypothetical protein Q8N91_05420 [Candidatus Omnitrophota bacterium]|nr:hypothetical protein [Candidatus Omnitrophota bacterium]
MAIRPFNTYPVDICPWQDEKFNEENCGNFLSFWLHGHKATGLEPYKFC